MARVFVSHSGADAALADELHRWLTDGSHQVFLDQHPHDGIEIGEEWQQRLHERLRWADAMVCLVTLAYVSSTWCTAEVSIAQSRGSRLLPILAEPRVIHPLLKAGTAPGPVRALRRGPGEAGCGVAAAGCCRRLGLAG